jgi:hypothetical protein
MEELSTFLGAMDLNISPVMSAKNKPHIVKNLRPLAEMSGTGYRLGSVKGNRLEFTIPNAPRVFKIKDISIPMGTGLVFTQTINTTAGNVVITFTYDASTIEEFMAQYQEAIEADVTLISLGVRTARKLTDEFLVWLNGVENIMGILPVATLNTSVHSEVVINPLVLGYTTVRDNLIVFTCNNSSTAGAGQIWKLPYVNGVAGSPELAYHANINFLKTKQIQAIGLYEASDTVRVYWTDNYNSLRSLNINDENCMAVDPELIDIQPSFEMNKVRYGEVIDLGSLKSGSYQYAYRLKGDGLVTRYSHLSSIVHIVEGSEVNGPYWRVGDSDQYDGTVPETSTTKAIQIELDDLDSRYERVEVVALYRKDATSLPVVSVIDEQPIPASRSVSFTHTGREIVRTLTIDEFLFISVAFDTVKSISTKDNLLIASNVKVKEYADLNINVRAYRWNNLQETYVGSGVAAATDWQTIDPFSSTTPQSDRDAVNPFNSDPNVAAALQYIYQSDGTTLGGEGPLLSYKFVKTNIDGDTSHSYKPNALQAQTAPFVNKSKKVVEIDFNDGFTANQNYHWNDYKNPLINGNLKGYQRGEVYRFAMVFYDKVGRPSYANWIGDIRFPEMWTTDADLTGSGNEFRLYKKDGDGSGSNVQLGNALGIEFTVDLSSVDPAILSQIKGYSIVRVERTVRDRTRLADGMLQPLVNRAGVPASIETEDAYVIMDRFGNYDAVLGDADANHVIGYFPDFLMGTHAEFTTGDRLVIHSVSEKFPGYKNSTGMQPFTEYYKLWDSTAISAGQPKFYDIENSAFVGRGKVLRFPTYDKFVNYAFRNATGDFEAVGNHCTYMVMDTAINWAAIYPHGVLADFRAGTTKFFATYERRINDQYGGADEYARSKNTYITTNNFVKVDSATVYPQTFQVYGGDTYVTFFGNTSGEKNIAEDLIAAMPDVIYAAAASPQMTGHFFPCEATFCNELRKGYHLANKADPLNSYIYPDVTLGSNPGQYAFDQYNIEEVYSYMNQTNIKYIPYPFERTFIKEYDYRHYASNMKIMQEEVDSWRIFSPFTYIDVMGIYGPINNVIEYQGNIYFFQDRAVGRLAVNPRAIVQDAVGTSLNIGSAGVIPYFDYIKTDTGSIHKWSFVTGSMGIYWFDGHSKNIMRLSQAGIDVLSVLYGVSSYLESNCSGRLIHNDTPVAGFGVAAGFNSLDKLSEILFTFHDSVGEGDLEVERKFTLSYLESPMEELRGFNCFYDFKPGIYLHINKKLLTPSTNGNSWNDLYVHNEGPESSWYGFKFPQYLSFYVVPHPAAQDKKFTNIKWISESIVLREVSVEDTLNKQAVDMYDTFTQARFSNPTQNTGWVSLVVSPLTGNVRRVKGEFRMSIPRNAVKPAAVLAYDNIYDAASLDSSRLFKEILEAGYLKVELERLSQSNHKFCVHVVTTNYYINLR